MCLNLTHFKGIHALTIHSSFLNYICLLERKVSKYKTFQLCKASKSSEHLKFRNSISGLSNGFFHIREVHKAEKLAYKCKQTALLIQIR